MLPHSASPGVLLIADDDEDTRALFRIVMEAGGHRVLEARNGEECLERAGGVDLVALDLRLPLLDGLEVTQRLKAQPSTRALPLLVVTALAGAGWRERAFSAGCDDLLTKPFSPRVLRRKVESLLLRPS